MKVVGVVVVGELPLSFFKPDPSSSCFTARGLPDPCPVLPFPTSCSVLSRIYYYYSVLFCTCSYLIRS